MHFKVKSRNRRVVILETKMFPSVQHRPVCNIGARAVRLQSFNTFKQNGAINSKSWSLSWLGERVGLLVSWIQKAGRGTNKLASDKKKKERLLSIFANHCSFVTGQRLRRALQIGELYSNLYSERSRWTLVGNIWRRLQSKHAHTGKLIAALAGVFMWEDEKIGDDELRRYFPHFWTVFMVLFVISGIRHRYYLILSVYCQTGLSCAVERLFLLLTNQKRSLAVNHFSRSGVMTSDWLLEGVVLMRGDAQFSQMIFELIF